jgi:hypothetical protein
MESALMIAWTERSQSSGIGAHDAVEYPRSRPLARFRFTEFELRQIRRRQKGA